MNLEDYAYFDDDRWYVDPNVSLGEQDAFIDNLRSTQAQNNAQIEQQTRNLGTQVPSNMGGLVGGGSYFRARQQTPQTNQTIADLNAVAQGAALGTALQNIVNKYKKKYRDSQYSTNGGGNNSNSKLTVDEKDDGSSSPYRAVYDRTEEEEIDENGKKVTAIGEEEVKAKLKELAERARYDETARDLLKRILQRAER